MFKTILPIKNLKKHQKNLKTIYFYFVLFSFIYLLLCLVLFLLDTNYFLVFCTGNTLRETDERRDIVRKRELPNRQRFEFIVRTYYALRYRFCLLLKEFKESGTF